MHPRGSQCHTNPRNSVCPRARNGGTRIPSGGDHCWRKQHEVDWSSTVGLIESLQKVLQVGKRWALPTWTLRYRTRWEQVRLSQPLRLATHTHTAGAVPDDLVHFSVCKSKNSEEHVCTYITCDMGTCTENAIKTNEDSVETTTKKRHWSKAEAAVK